MMWNNPVPSFPIYWRPIRMSKKETATLIMSQWDSLKTEIDILVTTPTDNYKIYQKIILITVGGKICQALNPCTLSSHMPL